MSEPVVGDGVVTIPETECEKMNEAYELLKLESMGNIQANNRDGRSIATAAMGSLTAGVAKAHNELGPVESRAVSGVMATPIASPTTGGGA
jgi:hypothetical protein